MEPLIRLRLLGSQLKQMIETFDGDKIVSFIFNHFLIKYNKNKQHDDDLSITISLIKNILNARKKNKSNKKDINNNDDEQLEYSLNTIPSEIIGECASYLAVVDYLNFSKSNRKIYVAVNSPPKLLSLDFVRYKQCDLNQFSTLKALQLDPIEFNKYIYIRNKQFRQLNALWLGNYCLSNHELIKTFLSTMASTKCIKFENILYLRCSHFFAAPGPGQLTPYDFNSFCETLMHFPNVIGLCLHDIYLTDFDENKQISNILPNLSMLSINADVNDSVLLLRNKLLNIHSNEIISVKYRESRLVIGNTSFPKLKELVVTDPNVDSLHKIIKNAPDLEKVTITVIAECDEMKWKPPIITLFKTSCKVERFSFDGTVIGVQKMMKLTEFALLNARDVIRTSITLVFECINNTDIDMDELNLNISRVINALEVSNINDFMVGIHIPATSDKTFEQTVKMFENKYSAHLFQGLYSVILSNKNCKINGCFGGWLNYNKAHELTF